MQLKQIEVSRHTDTGKEYKVVWVEAEVGLQLGYKVTFQDDPDVEWTVSKTYQQTIPYESINSRWGLSLPKSQRTEK